MASFPLRELADGRLYDGLLIYRSPEEIVKLLTTDLRLTTAYLQVHPKVYWIWNHRKWCLESVPLGPEGSEGWRNEFWKMELMLIEKMLDIDARNCELLFQVLESESSY